MGTPATDMERQHMHSTYTGIPLPSRIAKITMRSFTLYRSLQQLHAPLIK